MLDTQSVYALNKADKSAIICPSVTGDHIRLTREDFASEEEFTYWKTWSDENYHDTEKADHVFYNHIRSLHGLSEKAIAVPSPEDILIETLEQEERQELRQLLMKGLDSCLTSVQRRRLWLYCVDGLTVRQIAQAENTTHQNIVKSVCAAKKKIKNFLI